MCRYINCLLNDVCNEAVMFNIFGNRRRSVGPRGAKGKDAFNLIEWSPQAIKRLFRESAYVNIYFNSSTDGIVFEKNKPIGLKNRGLESDAKFLSQNFPKLVRIKDQRYMVELKDSIFQISPLDTGTTSPSIAIFALSFKSLSRSVEPKILFSNETGTRSISLRDKLIQGVWQGVLTIHSSGISEEVLFDQHEWAALLIEYRCIDGIVYCKYILNEETGILPTGVQDKQESTLLYIGGHPKKSSAHHAMGSFEMYYYFIDEGDYKLPEIMRKCLIRDISDRVDQ